MATDIPSLAARLAELREQRARLESLRSLLGDELTEQKAQELESQIQALVQTGGGAFLAGDVEVRNGDFVGRDKWQVWVERLYLNRPAAEVPPAALLTGYLRALAAECGRLPLGVVDPRFLQTGSETPVSLSSVYVDLDVLAPVRGEREEVETSSFLARLARGEGGERISILEAIADPDVSRFVLLGDPGSGKTTLVHYLAHALAIAQEADGRSTLLPEDSVLQGMLPARLVLREVSARYIPAGSEKGEASMLWHAFRADVASRLGEPAAEILLPHLQTRLLTERGLVLLDGLDEVPEPNRRCLLEAVADLAAQLPEARSRVVVTARPYAYADPRWHLAGFRTLTLAPFDGGQVERFVSRWYQAVYPVMGWDEATAQARGDQLADALAERPYLADLASRPLLLTLMATLHTSWGQLPVDLAHLYEETVNLLLSRWQRAREVQAPKGGSLSEPGIAKALAVGEDRIRVALHRLAFDAHERQGAGAEREAVPADIAQGEVLAAFAPLLPEDFNPRVLLRYLETRAGLLVGRAPGVYAFPHRSFQEYLAACHLADGQDFAAALRERVWADLAWWREVYLLGVGKAGQGGLGNAVHVVNTLVPEGPAGVPEPTDAHWRAAALAGQALLDLRFPEAAGGKPQFEAVLKRLRRWLAALLAAPGALAPRERAAAGDVLGRLGDPRPGVTCTAGVEDRPPLPDIVWCEVPAGPFLMGSPEGEEGAWEDEHPQHSVDLPAFLIGRYPITNAQYRPFVEGGGYDEPRYWTPEGWGWRTGRREPDLSPLDDLQDEEYKRSYTEWLAQRTVDRRNRPIWWDHPRWGQANRPVVAVCWYEALAYCRWLTERMREARGRMQVWRNGRIYNLQSFGSAQVRSPISSIQLPSEAQWEKAARGENARRWPWGDEWIEGQANTEEAGVGETSPAGAFPAGGSSCGALDMAGNVWEWTTSRWGRTSLYRPDYGYPYDPGDGREEPGGPDLRVLRGGSWVNSLWLARCASRYRSVPDNSFSVNVGMRVVVSLADSDF